MYMLEEVVPVVALMVVVLHALVKVEEHQIFVLVQTLYIVV